MHIIISIGNTDNKLSQQQWSEFVDELNNVIMLDSARIHFFGGAPTWEPWQNVAWIVEVIPDRVNGLFDMVTNIRRKYRQDSAFVMFGSGQMI